MHVPPLQLRSGLLIVLVCLSLEVSAGATARAGFPAADPAAPHEPAPLVLEDPLQPLVPQRPRTELDQDRVEALALFAAARMHEQKLEYAQALRLYQRALRCDPQALTVARSILVLAFRLKREEEAVRYVRKVVDLEKSDDPQRLQQLAAYLFRVGDLEAAVALYERALAARRGAPPTTQDVRLWAVMGRIYDAIDEYGKAADYFARLRHALDHPQEFSLDAATKKRLLGDPAAPTFNLFGESFLLADRLDEATSAFKKAHQLAPNQALLDFNLARVYARRGEPKQALAALEDCFKKHLDSEATAPFQLLGEVLDDLGRKDELIERLEKLRADDPENLPLGYFLAEQYHEAGQLDKAEPLYATLVEKTPTVAGYRRLAEIYRKTGRPEALLAILGEVVEKTGLLETLGPQVQAISGDADLVQSIVDAARKGIQDEPEQFSYHVPFAVALLALDAKQFETAAEFFDLVLKAQPDQASDVFIVWGVGLLLEERAAEAAKVFQRGIDEKALPDDDPRLHYLLAGALALDDQTDQALAAARKAVQMKEDVARFHARVAWVLYRADRRDEALEAYRRLIEKFDSEYDSSETRDVLREARLVLSTLYVLKEDLSEAEEWLQQVLDEFPDDVGASNDLGYLWADQGKHLQRSLKMIQYAVDAEPDNIAYRDSLGWVFYRLGRYQEAVAELEKAAAQGDPDPVILDHLGDALLKVDQPQKAKQAWRRAAKAFNKREEPEKANQVRQKIKAKQ